MTCRSRPSDTHADERSQPTSERTARRLQAERQTKEKCPERRESWRKRRWTTERT